MKKNNPLGCFFNKKWRKILLKMKILSFLILVLSFSATAKSYSQHQRVSMEMEQATILEVLNEIKEQTGLRFVYYKDMFDESNKVDIEVENEEVKAVLDELLRERGLECEVEEEVITFREILKLMPVPVKQEKKTIKGKVTDEKGEPLPGVSVVIKETSTGVSTDLDGNYFIEIVGDNITIVFSFVGMVSQEVIYIGQQTQNITLKADIAGLEEVVVVGYGTQKKVNLTGAIDVATSETFENKPVTNTGQALQGVIPNLNIRIPNGDPTASIDFNIRGYESINGGSPLILVDGVPMNINRINPDDIESINVLKDAAAAAIYGARAGFGVVLVETKKGNKGKINVQLNSQVELSKPIFHFDPLDNSYDYVTWKNIASLRGEGSTLYSDEDVAAIKAYYENPESAKEYDVVNGELKFYGYTDYKDKVLKDFSPSYKNNLSISGSTEKANYYASFGYLNKKGLFKVGNDDFKRYNILMKMSFDVNDWITLDEKIAFNSEVSDKPHTYHHDVNLNTLARADPLIMIKFPKLEGYEQYEGMYIDGKSAIPYRDLGGRKKFTNSDVWLTSGITLQPISRLKIRGEFTYNVFNKKTDDVASKVQLIGTDVAISDPFTYGFSGNDYVYAADTRNQYYAFNTFAEYTYDSDSPHYFKGMVGFNQEWTRNEWFTAKAFSLITPSVPDLGATTGSQETNGGKSHMALRGVFYRFNYIYDDRYLVEFNGRYDGTSRFPKDDRFGFFPSVSVGWRISNERFMKSTRDYLDNLKIRASYGSLGNQQVLDRYGNQIYYPYISTMGIGLSNYLMNNSKNPMVRPSGLVSPTLTWEQVISKNIGLDVTLLDQRLNATFDIYTRETKDMLMGTKYPDVLGTSSPKVNAADLKTSGWELSISWHDKINTDLDYSVAFSLADSKAEITKYDNPTGALSEHYVGKEMGEIWGYETVGIFQTEEEVANAADQSRFGANWKPGDVHYRDLNGDGELSPGDNTLEDHGDLRVIGNTTPRYTFGLNLNVNYKNWSLAAFFQGVGKRDYWPGTDSNSWFWPFNANTSIEKWHITETWSEDNRDALFFAPSNRSDKNRQKQTRFLQDASYVRLKNLSISYSLPKQVIRRVGLDKVQLYLTGQNLFEISSIHKPLDPEYVFSSAVQYPLQRVYTLGARVSF